MSGCASFAIEVARSKKKERNFEKMEKSAVQPFSRDGSRITLGVF